ncbi:MAG: L,D-transpeptidase family protein [Acidimicrobiales bacterium]
MSALRRAVTIAILAMGVTSSNAFIPAATTAGGASVGAPLSPTSTLSATATLAIRGVPPLRSGNRGPLVRALQQRLGALGYWVGPVDGQFGPLTLQGVFALQKAASISVDGVVGVNTAAALARGAIPTIRVTKGNEVQINLQKQLLVIVRNGKLATTLNTSTGGGYSYTSEGVTSIATTPRGVFTIFRQVNAMDLSPLGELWRPKYFSGGYAIHGSNSVPPVAVSHGCVRLSNSAMDWIWASNRMPIGTKVRIY